MRTWRVGTISMGIALLSLGIFLFVAQFLSIDLTKVMLNWWPIILIVLGLEILLYLYFNRKEKPLLKYDFLSIIFVGIIGMTGILFAALSTSGLLDIAGEAIGREEQTYNLPDFTYEMDDSVKRIVLNGMEYPVTVESTSEKAVSMFGTYSSWIKNDKNLLANSDDYMTAKQKGDTLYLTVKSLPSSKGGLFNYHADMKGTLLIPENVKLEIIGEENDLNLKPRTLAIDWSINDASEVALYLESGSDVYVEASEVNELINESGKWTVTEDKAESRTDEGNARDGVAYAEEYQKRRSGTFKMGEGTSPIHITDAYKVTIKVE